MAALPKPVRELSRAFRLQINECLCWRETLSPFLTAKLKCNLQEKRGATRFWGYLICSSDCVTEGRLCFSRHQRINEDKAVARWPCAARGVALRLVRSLLRHCSLSKNFSSRSSEIKLLRLWQILIIEKVHAFFSVQKKVVHQSSLSIALIKISFQGNRYFIVKRKERERERKTFSFLLR